MTSDMKYSVDAKAQGGQHQQRPGSNYLRIKENERISESDPISGKVINIRRKSREPEYAERDIDDV